MSTSDKNSTVIVRVKRGKVPQIKNQPVIEITKGEKDLAKSSDTEVLTHGNVDASGVESERRIPACVALPCHNRDQYANAKRQPTSNIKLQKETEEPITSTDVDNSNRDSETDSVGSPKTKHTSDTCSIDSPDEVKVRPASETDSVGSPVYFKPKRANETDNVQSALHCQSETDSVASLRKMASDTDSVESSFGHRTKRASDTDSVGTISVKMVIPHSETVSAASSDRSFSDSNSDTNSAESTQEIQLKGNRLTLSNSLSRDKTLRNPDYNMDLLTNVVLKSESKVSVRQDNIYSGNRPAKTIADSMNSGREIIYSYVQTLPNQNNALYIDSSGDTKIPRKVGSSEIPTENNHAGQIHNDGNHISRSSDFSMEQQKENQETIYLVVNDNNAMIKNDSTNFYHSTNNSSEVNTSPNINIIYEDEAVNNEVVVEEVPHKNTDSPAEHCQDDSNEESKTEENLEAGTSNAREVSVEDKGIWLKLLTSCDFIQPIGVLHGYTRTKEEFLRVKVKYEEISMTAFMIKPGLPSKPGFDGNSKFSVRFEDPASDKRPHVVPYDGVPFIIMGSVYYHCHLGYDSNKHRKAKRSESEKKKKIVAKKVGCTSKLFSTDVVKFPEYKIRGRQNSTYQRKRLGSQVRHDLSVDCESGERRFYFRLPSVQSHEPHHTVEGSIGRNPVHPAITEHMVDLFRKGERKARIIAEKIRIFVEDKLCKDMIEPPHPQDRRFRPNLRDIRNKLKSYRKEHEDEFPPAVVDDVIEDDADPNPVDYFLPDDPQQQQAMVQHLRQGCTDVLMELLCLIDYDKDSKTLSELSYVLNKLFDYFLEARNNSRVENTPHDEQADQSVQAISKDQDMTLPKYLYDQMQVLKPKTCTMEIQTEPVCVTDIDPAVPEPEDNPADLDTEEPPVPRDCCLKHAGKWPIVEPKVDDQHEMADTQFDDDVSMTLNSSPKKARKSVCVVESMADGAIQIVPFHQNHTNEPNSSEKEGQLLKLSNLKKAIAFDTMNVRVRIRTCSDPAKQSLKFRKKDSVWVLEPCFYEDLSELFGESDTSASSTPSEHSKLVKAMLPASEHSEYERRKVRLKRKLDRLKRRESLERSKARSGAESLKRRKLDGRASEVLLNSFDSRLDYETNYLATPKSTASVRRRTERPVVQPKSKPEVNETSDPEIPEDQPILTIIHNSGNTDSPQANDQQVERMPKIFHNEDQTVMVSKRKSGTSRLPNADTAVKKQYADKKLDGGQRISHFQSDAHMGSGLVTHTHVRTKGKHIVTYEDTWTQSPFTESRPPSLAARQRYFSLSGSTPIHSVKGENKPITPNMKSTGDQSVSSVMLTGYVQSQTEHRKRISSRESTEIADNSANKTQRLSVSPQRSNVQRSPTRITYAQKIAKLNVPSVSTYILTNLHAPVLGTENLDKATGSVSNIAMCVDGKVVNVQDTKPSVNTRTNPTSTPQKQPNNETSMLKHDASPVVKNPVEKQKEDIKTPRTRRAVTSYASPEKLLAVKQSGNLKPQIPKSPSVSFVKEHSPMETAVLKKSPKIKSKRVKKHVILNTRSLRHSSLVDRKSQQTPVSSTKNVNSPSQSVPVVSKKIPTVTPLSPRAPSVSMAKQSRVAPSKSKDVYLVSGNKKPIKVKLIQ